MSFMLSELMGSKWMAMLSYFVLGFLMLGGGGRCEGCLEEERLALSRLKPFFPFVDSTFGRLKPFFPFVDSTFAFGRIGGLDYYSYISREEYDPVEEKESSINCCKWERVECNPTTGRLTHLFLNLTDQYGVVYDEYYRKKWYLNASLFLPFEELQYLSLSGNLIAGCVVDQGFERLSSKLNKLEILDLSFNYFSDNIFASISEFSSLKSLSLKDNRLTLLNPTNDIKMLSKLNNLETLDLSYNNLGNNISSQLHDFTSLKSLNLRDCGLEGTINLLGEMRLNKLEVLGLADNQFTNTIFSSLAALPNLKSLDLGWNKLKGAIDVKDLNALSNLEKLILSSNDVTEFVPSQDTDCNISLQSLNLFSSLKTLYLDGFNIEETRLHSRSQNKWQNLTNLEELELWFSSLPFDFIGILPSLKQLHMFGCYLDDGLFMQDTLNLKNLETLGVDETSLGNNFFRRIGSMPSLKILRLWGYGSNDTLHLQEIDGLSSLEVLDIRCYSEDDHISLGNNFFQKLGAMAFLKFLRLSNCGLNDTLQCRGFCGLTNLRALDMSNNHLMGNLPECISNFTSLESLDLSSNHFSGEVSVFESLTSLKELRLSDNYFQIPSSLGPFFNLSELTHFYADNNIIYVESQMQSVVPRLQLIEISFSYCRDARQFPQFLYHQRNLRFVDLSDLNLKGEFPNWLLQNNTNLESLYLANNSLLGPVELPFLAHTSLSYLDISKNFFYGKVPVEIGAKLPSLRFLNMSKNHFHGSIPASIGDMNFLNYLDLSDNQLSGGLPEHLAMGCSLLDSLILSNNRLQGLSSNFNLINLSELRLDGNHFSGKIPYSLSNYSQLSTLDVSNNELVGKIPRWMENMSSLSKLDLSNNEISGKIPNWMGSMSNLEEIVMARNHLEGPLPKEFCHLNNLKLLDLSVNNISGHIPSCFSPLWISQVHLSRNKLQGPLTNAFRNSTILVTLDLSNNHLTGNIPNWIGNLSQLSYLLLNNNHFEGGIPVQLCNLDHLSLIDLSNNNLSGTIPSCLKITTRNEISEEYALYLAAKNVSNSFSIDEPIQFTTKNKSYTYKGRVLTYLSGIDLSCNKLTGDIPHEVKNFRNIFALNLSHNCLIGPIPLAFSDLKQIESLDLSHNNLSGTIPPQLVGLYRLSYFSVAYNNLSGSTPVMTAQFSTFEESSYIGNPLLCGKPLPKNCSPSGPSPSSLPKGLTDKGFLDMTAFYASFVASYVVVILSIASVLYINPYWRRAWFYHIGEINKRCQYFLEDHILPKRFHCGN